MTRYGAELWHEGVSRRDGAPGPGSGRYPLGSGKRPFQHGPPGGRGRGILKRKKKAPEVDAKKDEKLSEEEKKQIIETGDVKVAFTNRRQLSNAEIDAVLMRNAQFTRLKDIAQKDVKTGRQRVESLSNFLDTATKAAERGIGAYNVSAKILNAFGDMKLPIIGAENKPGAEAAARKAKAMVRIQELLKDGSVTGVLGSQKDFSNEELKYAADRKDMLARLQKQADKDEEKKKNNA